MPIEVLGYPRIAELAKAAGLIDEVRSIETRAAAGFFARNAALDEDLSNYFARFSVMRLQCRSTIFVSAASTG